MKKRALIVGGAGFVGQYLMRHLAEDCEMQVGITKLAHEMVENTQCDIFDMDLARQEETAQILETFQPDYLFHLAAQSSVALSWKKPQETVAINVNGSINVLEAVRQVSPKTRTVLIGSGEEYGHIRSEDCPVSEETVLRPGNIYAVTKACQNMIGKIYADAYGMNIVCVRAFNHIGPGQAAMFVVSDFCKQVAEIEAGCREPVLYVGNLSAKRDFTDVRDVVRAYALLVTRGKSGELYNVGSGTAVSIAEILDKIVKQSKSKIEIKVDSNRLRPVDVPIIEADIRKLQAVTNWRPEIPFEQTIFDTLESWRQKIQ